MTADEARAAYVKRVLAEAPQFDDARRAEIRELMAPGVAAVRQQAAEMAVATPRQVATPSLDIPDRSLDDNHGSSRRAGTQRANRRPRVPQVHPASTRADPPAAA